MEKVAIITGSGGGLGKGIAERLGSDGFNIVLNDVNQEVLNETLEEFKEAGINVLAVKGDVSKKEDQINLVKQAVEAFGQIDVFVNNAGIEVVGPFLNMEASDLNRAFSINVNGVVFGTQAAAEQFIKQKTKGKVIKDRKSTRLNSSHVAI